MCAQIGALIDIHVANLSQRNDVLELLRENMRNATIIHKLRTYNANERIIYIYKDCEERSNVDRGLYDIREKYTSCEYFPYPIPDSTNVKPTIIQTIRTYFSTPSNLPIGIGNGPDIVIQLILNNIAELIRILIEHPPS